MTCSRLLESRADAMRTLTLGESEAGWRTRCRFGALALGLLAACSSAPAATPPPDAELSNGQPASRNAAGDQARNAAGDQARDAASDQARDAASDQARDASTEPWPITAIPSADAGPSDGTPPDVATDSPIQTARGVPASNGTLRLPFDVAIGGDITGMNMSVSVIHDVGTLSIGANQYPVVVYQQIPWSNFTQTLYQALAVLPDHWAVIWFYCMGNRLTNIEYEDTRGAPIAVYDATGSCTSTMAPIDAAVSVPSSAPALGPLVKGFRVSGTTLTYDGSAPGVMTLDGRPWMLHPFNLVDCSTACGTPGWFELHALYWDPASSQTCFGILYLEMATPDSVRLEYSICLPDLAMVPSPQTIPSAWRQTP
jgi:hypothetical protein